MYFKLVAKDYKREGKKFTATRYLMNKMYKHNFEEFRKASKNKDSDDIDEAVVHEKNLRN